jgi:D-alanyl-D-alanine carboxypeptidase/D-alanyl-D-alanine-endopeptidase (penicillin-binding protein 4)
MPVRALRASVVTAVVGALLCVASPAPASAHADSPPATRTVATLATPVLSARRLPSLLAAPLADARTQALLNPIITHANPTSCFVASVDGRTIDDVRGGLPVLPASTEKLLTASALLAHMSASATFETKAVSKAHVDHGVLGGDLYVVGGGDPILETTGYQPTQEDRNEPYDDFAKMAAALQRAGITKIDGNVIGDESRYDAQRYLPSWPGRYITAGETGPLSALMVNGGFTGLTDHPESPAADRQPGDPPALAAATLITLLRQRGITVTGHAASGSAPSGASLVATLPSLPLSQDLTEMLRRSDNTAAELLNKEVGYLVSHRGTTAAGAAAVQSTLAAMGLPMKGSHTVDGSGLDLGNRVTCRLLVALLDHEGPNSTLAHALPVASESGTLRFRLAGTPAAGRIDAKTGTLDTVNALAGFAHSVSGQVVTFAFVVNGSSPDAPALIDQASIVLSRYGVGTSLQSLAPLPPGS